MTGQPTPETVTTGVHNDALLRLHITTAERDDARAEQDIAFSLGEHAMLCVHHTDAERVANTVGGNCPICNKAQIRQLRAERDALAKERDALLTELDEAAKGNA